MTTTTPPVHRAPGKRYDWPRIKADYVEGITDDNGRIVWPTYEEVAFRHGVRHSQNIRTRAAKERWTDDRAAFQRRIEAQRQTERSTELASLAADLDVNALRIARSGLSLTAARLQELGTLASRRAEHLRATEGLPTAGAPPAPDSEEVATLSRAATQWYDLGTKALGDAPVTRIEVDVDVDVAVDDGQRAARILAILNEAGVLDRGRDDVVEVGTRAIGAGADPEVEPVHPGHPDDDTEREPEAGGVPAARSA